MKKKIKKTKSKNLEEKTHLSKNYGTIPLEVHMVCLFLEKLEKNK